MRLKIGHNLDASFGTPKMNFGQDFNGVISDDFSIYVYGGIGYRFTLRNIYIQGNTWEDPFRQDLDHYTQLSCPAVMQIHNKFVTYLITPWKN